MSTPAHILINLFSFISNEGSGDLDPDHYQIAFRSHGLGASMVFKYLVPGKEAEKELGTIGLLNL